MESNRQEKFQNSIRNESQIQLLFTKAINQSVDLFSVDLQKNELEQLTALAAEEHTTPFGKVAEMRRLARESDRAAFKGVISNILLTISENLTDAERNQFAGTSTSLLDI
ncbi:hypothetical protein K2P47_01260 [Patescibacteria group bacterium]|nr:hypothetical protein [Patescibacteria group bacterium]